MRGVNFSQATCFFGARTYVTSYIFYSGERILSIVIISNKLIISISYLPSSVMFSIASKRVSSVAFKQTKRSLAFARIISFKVQSVDEGKAVDASVEKNVLPAIKDFPGCIGTERFLCGGELDYKMVTKWDNVDNLKNFVAGDAPLVDGLVKEFNISADAIHTQNFMHYKF